LEQTAASPRSLSALSKGYAIAIVGTIIWSSTAVFIRYLTETYQMPPLVLAFWRDFFVAVILVTIFSAANRSLLRLERRHVRFIILNGLILSLFNSAWTFSVALNGAAVSTVLAYSSAAFTALIGWKWLNEELGPAKILAVGLSMIGCAFVSGAYQPANWQVNPIGIAAGLISGVGFAAYTLMSKTATQRGINSWTALLYTFGTGAMFLLIFNLLPLPPSGTPGILQLNWLGSTWMGWAVLVGLAFWPTIGGYGLYTYSLSYLPASVGNLIATLEPSFTALQSYVLLAERFTTPQVVGSLLIIAGVIILRIYEFYVPPQS
jgi:drug/metabolite transporter (DMT)-like permease